MANITGSKVPFEPSDIGLLAGTMIVEIPVKQEGEGRIQRLLESQTREAVENSAAFKVLENTGEAGHYAPGTYVMFMQPPLEILVSPSEIFYAIVDESTVIATIKGDINEIHARAKAKEEERLNKNKKPPKLDLAGM